MTFSVRNFESTDEGFVTQSWLTSYARSAYGRAHGYAKKLGEPFDLQAWAQYWRAHAPIVSDMIQQSTVTIACDPEQPEIIWGWACVSGDTVHYIMTKRAVHRASAERDARGVWRVTTGLSGEIYRALLGDRLTRACAYTHELVDMRRPELSHQGIQLPSAWYLDSTWFARNARRAA
jgi:hypothetical protein